MVKYPDITLVLQGPLNEKSTIQKVYETYKDYFAEIIVSTYQEQIPEEYLKFINDTGMVLCDLHSLFEIPENVRNISYNLGYHAFTAGIGIAASRTKYTIKHRTDEYWSNLDKLIEKFMQNDNKWVSNTTVLNAKSNWLFHMPDHLFIAKTDLLVATFRRIILQLLDDTYEKNHEGGSATEITFTKAWLRTNGVEPDPERHDDQMTMFFDIVNDREFHPFIIRINGANMTLTEKHQLDPSMDGVNDLLTALNRKPLPW
jgi:hypothetical protein